MHIIPCSSSGLITLPSCKGDTLLIMDPFRWTCFKVIPFAHDSEMQLTQRIEWDDEDKHIRIDNSIYSIVSSKNDCAVNLCCTLDLNELFLGWIDGITNINNFISKIHWLGTRKSIFAVLKYSQNETRHISIVDINREDHENDCSFKPDLTYFKSIIFECQVRKITRSVSTLDDSVFVSNEKVSVGGLFYPQTNLIYQSLIPSKNLNERGRFKFSGKKYSVKEAWIEN